MKKENSDILSVLPQLSWKMILTALVAALLVSLTPLHRVIIPDFVGLHTILEFACIAICAMIFVVQYVLRSHNIFQRFQVLGVPFLGIAIIDLFHTMSYRGLPDFINENSPQKSITFWLAARLLEAIVFLFFAFYTRYNINVRIHARNVYALLFLYIAFVSALAFHFTDWLPIFADERGSITQLKINLEYLFMFVHLMIAWLLCSKNRVIDKATGQLVTASLIIAISGLTFSSFSDGHDIVIFLGHLLKLIAYIYIFGSCLTNELLEPYYQLVALNSELKTQTHNIRKLHMQLQHAERLSAVGQSLSTVVHDLNNMLAVTDMATKSIMDLVAGKEDSYESIRRYTRMIMKSLSKVKTFNSLILEKAKLNPKKNDVQDLMLCGEVENIRPLLEAILPRGLDFNVHCDQTARVNMSLFEFEQILMNLVVNAKDALQDYNDKTGKIDLKIEKVNSTGEIKTIQGSLPSGSYVKMSVSDNGAGIPAEILPHIFNSFFTTKDGTKGTGLGLSTVKELVEKWQGQIAVQTQIDQGTEFTVYLPAK